MALKRFCDRCGAEITDSVHGGARLNYRKNVEGYEGLARGVICVWNATPSCLNGWRIKND